MFFPVFASAVVSSLGCGTGCSISVVQIGQPVPMKKGWFRVKTKATTTIYGMDGRPVKNFRGQPMPASAVNYRFGNCQANAFAVGKSPKLADATFLAVYRESGKITDNAGQQAYTQLSRLCKAVGESMY